MLAKDVKEGMTLETYGQLGTGERYRKISGTVEHIRHVTDTRLEFQMAIDDEGHGGGSVELEADSESGVEWNAFKPDADKPAAPKPATTGGGDRKPHRSRTR